MARRSTGAYIHPCRLVYTLPTVSPFSVWDTVQMPEYRAILNSQEAYTVSLWSSTLDTAKSRVKNSNDQALLGSFPPKRSIGDLKRNSILQAVHRSPATRISTGDKRALWPATNTRL